MRFLRRSDRFVLPGAWPLAWALICLAGCLVAVVSAREGSSSDQEDTTLHPAVSALQAQSAGPHERIREGTRLVDQSGVFEMTGGRVTFFVRGGQQRFVGLENLNLERVARAMAESIDRQQWSVTGTVTEYQGVNYLLIEKAVVKDEPAVTGTADPTT